MVGQQVPRARPQWVKDSRSEHEWLFPDAADVGPGSLVCRLGAIRLWGRKGLSVQGEVEKKGRLKKGSGVWRSDLS